MLEGTIITHYTKGLYFVLACTLFALNSQINTTWQPWCSTEKHYLKPTSATEHQAFCPVMFDGEKQMRGIRQTRLNGARCSAGSCWCAATSVNILDGQTLLSHWNIDTNIKLHVGVNTWERLYLMDKGGQWFQAFWIVNTLRQQKLKHCYAHASHFSRFLYIFWNANLIDVIAGQLRLGFNKRLKRSE